MSFKLRNTLILMTISLLLIAASIYVLFFYYPKNIEKYSAEVQHLNQSIVQMPERELYLDQILTVIEEKKETLSTLNKTVSPSVSIAESFEYLDKIQDRYGAIQFALSFVDHFEGSGYGYKTFSLSGEATYSNIFSLIWALERGPKIYAIDNLTMRGVESSTSAVNKPRVVVPFELEIRALYANVSGLPPIKKTLSDVKVPKKYSLFFPVISKNLPSNSKGLLESERAELRAILPDKAIVADHKGDIHVLHEGDQVYLGYLTKIDQRQNLIEFTLNKGGIVERFVLKLPFPSQEGRS